MSYVIICFLYIVSVNVSFGENFHTSCFFKRIIKLEAINGIQSSNKKKICIARGSVIVSQGNYIITADRLITYFDKNKKLISVKAEGDVIMSYDDIQKIYCDTLHYLVNKRIITFIGDAKLIEIQFNRSLEGNIIIFYFDKDKKNKIFIKRMDVEGKVLLKINNYVISSDKLLYLKYKNIFYIMNNIRIIQNNYQNNAEYVIINITRSSSELFAIDPLRLKNNDSKKIVRILFNR